MGSLGGGKLKGGCSTTDGAGRHEAHRLLDHSTQGSSVIKKTLLGLHGEGGKSGLPRASALEGWMRKNRALLKILSTEVSAYVDSTKKTEGPTGRRVRGKATDQLFSLVNVEGLGGLKCVTYDVPRLLAKRIL